MKCAAACSVGSLHSVNYCSSCRRGYHSRFWSPTFTNRWSVL